MQRCNTRKIAAANGVTIWQSLQHPRHHSHRYGVMEQAGPVVWGLL